MVNYGVTYINRFFTAPTIYSSPATVITSTHSPHSRSYDSKYPNSVLHFRRHFFSTEYFVVESTYIANTLAEHADHFENVSFANRIFRLCRRSNPAKGFERVMRAHIDAGDCRNVGNTEVGGCKTSSSTAAVDNAYQKFAMEMNAKGDEKVGHRLYQTLFEGKEHLMELQTVFDVKNDGYCRHKITKATSMETIIPGLSSCIKELVVLLEAKANRRTQVDIREYGYRHGVNILGVAFFGQSIEELTSSGCEFYPKFDELYDMWLNSEREGSRLFPTNWLRRFGKSTRSGRIEEVKSFFKAMVVDCADQKSGKMCVLKSLVEQCGLMDESREELIGKQNLYNCNLNGN